MIKYIVKKGGSYLGIFSVSEITCYIKDLLDGDGTLADVFVRGEISNFKRHYSGHCYFTLKDAGATLRCVMFRSRAQFLKFEPRDGLKIVAGGHISVFERDGQYQLYVDQLVPAGLGELGLALQQLKEKLAAEGLFAEERKKPLPLLPKAVGVITSPVGAALRDIITVARRRHPGIPIVLYPVQVQGPESAPQIAHAIRVFNRLANVDVLIVGRGGGSLEELWAFNEEETVRAIAASAIPVVSAVGHETDYTLADFAADRRAATPSQAAEIVFPDVHELERYIRMLRQAMETHARNYIQRYRLLVDQYRDSRALRRRPIEIVAAKQQLLDISLQRLHHIVKEQFTAKQHRFKVIAEKLAVLNPLMVLARGYSIVRTPDGRIIRAADQVGKDQLLEIVLYHGRIEARVEKIGEEHDNGRKD